MEFAGLTGYWQRLEEVSSRLAMTEILAEMLRAVDAEEVVSAVYLSLGQLGPKYAQVEFGMAEKMVARAVGEAYEMETDGVWKLYKQFGDMGNVVEHIQAKSAEKESSTITVAEVYDMLMTIAKDGGAGSQERKVVGLAALLKLLPWKSAKYAVRIPLANLRLGFSDMTVLDALSWMAVGDKSLRVGLEEAFNVAADVGLIAQEIKTLDEKLKTGNHTVKVEKIQTALQKITVQLGTPVVPALCQRLETFDEVIEKIGEVACEPKYDGTRLQIHWRRSEKNGWHLRSFTRNLEENSAMFLELDTLGDHLLADEVILDGEAVGWDVENNKWLPFQVTMTRKRKHGMQEQLDKVPLRYMMFDVLYWKKPAKVPAELKELPDGDVHGLPFVERRNILEKIILQKGLVAPTPIEITDDPAELREWHVHYLKQGLEGVVIKRWHGPYVPSRKGWNWVKMKEVESAAAGLADTLDCVVMGYYRGRGKRADFGLGAFLVGVWDKKAEKLLTVTKIGTGLSDEQFRELHKRLEPLRSVEHPKNYEVNKLLEPDVWVKPEIVVEVAADNITKSPSHSAGLALRFPRLVKFRDDKNVRDASTLEDVEKLWKMQGIG